MLQLSYEPSTLFCSDLRPIRGGIGSDLLSDLLCLKPGHSRTNRVRLLCEVPVQTDLSRCINGLIHNRVAAELCAGSLTSAGARCFEVVEPALLLHLLHDCLRKRAESLILLRNLLLERLERALRLSEWIDRLWLLLRLLGLLLQPDQRLHELLVLTLSRFPCRSFGLVAVTLLQKLRQRDGRSRRLRWLRRCRGFCYRSRLRLHWDASERIDRRSDRR